MTSLGERLRQNAFAKEVRGVARWVELGVLFEEERFVRTVSDGKTGRGRGKQGGHYESDDPEERHSVDYDASQREPGGVP